MTTRSLAEVPRAGTGSALLLAALTITAVAAWPERPDTANTTWYVLAPVRATGLATWAWLLGLAGGSFGARAGKREALGRLALGALLTAPLEAFAHAASAPDAPLAWSLVAPLPLAWFYFGLARGLALLAARARMTPALPILAAAVAVGLVTVDLRWGLGWWTPWTLPVTPGAGSAAVLAAASAAVLAWTWREERPSPPAPEANG